MKRAMQKNIVSMRTLVLSAIAVASAVHFVRQGTGAIGKSTSNLRCFCRVAVCRRCHRIPLRAAKTLPLGSPVDDIDESTSPASLIRRWRSHRRAKLARAIEEGWTRECGALRGDDAACELRDIGALVGGTPRIWIYFLASPGHEDRLLAVHRIFERVLDKMRSYTVLNFNGGMMQGLAGPSEFPPRFQASYPMMNSALDVMDAEQIRQRYDLVVAVDPVAMAESTASAIAAGSSTSNLASLLDFVDVHERWPAGVLGPRLSIADYDNIEALQNRVGIENETDAVTTDLLALSAAGLERILIAAFPKELKDSLHPYMRPVGL